MTPDLIAQAEAALDGVTPGEWSVEYKRGTTRLMMGDSCQMCDETYYPWTPDNDKDWRFIAWCRAGVPALIARIRELEGERVLSKAAYDGVSSLLLDVQQDCINERKRADAAEAKLAEVEKERDYQHELRETCIEERDTYSEERDAAEATVATLTAQVEAMRGEMTPQKAARYIIDHVLQEASHEAARMRLLMCKATMTQRHPSLPMHRRWAMVNEAIHTLAALTTENQTNG